MRATTAAEARDAVAHGDGQITFQRRRTWQDFLRSYTILVDDTDIGTLRRSGEMSVDLEEGRHTCRAAISWTGSQEIVVPVRAGIETRILVSPSRRDGGPSPIDRAASTDDWLALTVVGDAASSRD